MAEVKPIKVTGYVPVLDGTDNLKLIEIEITDPEMIKKITMGMINDFSLDTQSFKKEN